MYKAGYVATEDDKVFFENWKYKSKKKTYKLFTIDWYINNPNNSYTDSKFTRELFSSVKTMLEYQIKVKRFYIKHYDLYKDASDIEIGSTELKNFNIIDLAVAFTILHTSLINRITLSVDQSLTLENRPKFLQFDFVKGLTALHQEYLGIKIPKQAKYGASAMDLLKDTNFNREGTLVYLDSPYICTMQYAKGFDKALMLDLIDSCKAFKGDFIFSCRINLPNQTIKNLRIKKIGNTDLENKNKFIWFMEQWLNEEYNVLFKVPKKINVSILNNVYIYLKRCITEPINLELMICNFNFEEPDYEKFVEKFMNAYNPKKTIKSDESVFVQLPVKEIAKLVIGEYSKL